MEWVETTGRTIEEATDAALAALGVAPDDAEVEVLADAKMGLFGRLREEARVRARVRPATPRAKEERERRRRPKADAPPAAPETPVAEGSTKEAAASAEVKQTKAPAKKRVPRDEEKIVEEQDRGAEVPVADQAAVAQEFLEGLLAAMGISGASTAVHLIDEDTAELQVTGEDLGLLIGPKGATLLAIQDLARVVVQRRTAARHGRLMVDIAGYRAKRREALERFTQKVAGDVVAKGSAIALEPMNAADRKVVHDTANEIDGVITSSQGEDPNRRVVIQPA
jgi:spoIIIJ-associated protein